MSDVFIFGNFNVKENKSGFLFTYLFSYLNILCKFSLTKLVEGVDNCKSVLESPSFFLQKLWST